MWQQIFTAFVTPVYVGQSSEKGAAVWVDGKGYYWVIYRTLITSLSSDSSHRNEIRKAVTVVESGLKEGYD